MAQWRLILVSGSNAELSSISLDTDLAVAHGGTGQSTLASGEVLLGNGGSGVNSTARGTLSDAGSGKIVVSGGTNATLGSVTLDIGGDIASGSSLNDISDLASTDGNFIVGSATGWVVESSDTARTSLGLGTSDSPTFAALTLNGAIVNDSSVAATQLTGSFTGSFVGDGSALTGLPAAAITTYTGAADNRIITSVDATGVQGEANLTFDGTTLQTTGSAIISDALTVEGNTTLGDASGDTVTINAQTINLANIAAGTDDSVVVWNGSSLVTDEIDSRVWGTSLIDGVGVAARVGYFSDTNTLTSAATFTFDGSTLTVGSSTYGTDAYIAGDLVVAGTASFENATSLLVSDRFVLFNSGSSTGDGGFVVQSGSSGAGVAMVYDDSVRRFGLQMETMLDSGLSTATPDAYVAAVIDVDTAGFDKDSGVHRAAGNIMISGSEAWIYV